MTTTTTTSQPTAYAVFYCGAPYGDNETGHVVSNHRSLEAAELAMHGHPACYGSNGRVMAKVNGEWVAAR